MCICTGDVANFGNSPLNKIYINPVGAEKISESIENLVANKIKRGETSGSFIFPFTKTFTQVTFKGEPLATNSRITNIGADATFTWDASADITWS